MRTIKYSEKQIVGFLKQAEAGLPIKDRCRKVGFSDATFYKWRAKQGGMEVPGVTNLRLNRHSQARTSSVGLMAGCQQPPRVASSLTSSTENLSFQRLME